MVSPSHCHPIVSFNCLRKSGVSCFVRSLSLMPGQYLAHLTAMPLTRAVLSGDPTSTLSTALMAVLPRSPFTTPAADGCAAGVALAAAAVPPWVGRVGVLVLRIFTTNGMTRSGLSLV